MSAALTAALWLSSVLSIDAPEMRKDGPRCRDWLRMGDTWIPQKGIQPWDSLDLARRD